MELQLRTVQHTGTTWAFEGLKSLYPDLVMRGTVKHFGGVETLQESFFTTRRDALRTAASWGNRGVDWNRWLPQWEGWFELMALKPKVFDFTQGLSQHGFDMPPRKLNESEDRNGLHAALDRGDMEHFFRFVPRELVEDVWRSQSLM